ncbi:MAG: hypothetical protein F4X65_04565 [Chloroflexi bacterium]|nr:hypothetical protein [Chloroflexota bacterium]
MADVGGPDTFTFEELLHLLVSALGVSSLLAHMPNSVGLALTQLVGLLKGNIALTQDEVVGLMAGLLSSEGVPASATRLRDWLTGNTGGLGRR